MTNFLLLVRQYHFQRFQFSFQSELLNACQEVREKYGKPIILIMPDITTEARMVDLEVEWRHERDNYQAAGFPVFKSLDRAARALSHFIAYHRLRAESVGRLNLSRPFLTGFSISPSAPPSWEPCLP